MADHALAEEIATALKRKRPSSNGLVSGVGKMERRLLAIIAILLALQLIVQVVPGPFSSCDVTYSYGTGAFGEDQRRISCTPMWWPS